MLYQDRRDAGQRLAAVLDSPNRTPVDAVLGLARGGVVVAEPIAAVLGARLYAFVARKLGAPHQPEFGFGAVAAGIAYLDEVTVARLAMDAETIERIRAEALRELTKRQRDYERVTGAPNISGQSVVLADDGLATGVTAIAAARSLRRSGAKSITLAVPVGAIESVDRLRDEVDVVLCLATPEPFGAVGAWYADFKQVEDPQVIRLLKAATPAAQH